jgi:hypothetical protein
MDWGQALHQNFYRLSLLLIAAGFISILGELLFSMHLTGTQSIGIYSAVLGALFAIHGFCQPQASKALAFAFCVLSLFGLIGTYEHYESREMKGEFTGLRQSINHENASTTRVTSPPMMAPLSLSGLSMFAILVLLAFREEETLQDDKLTS